jgi:DNA-directed RNA polymerase specialized sigma24 family protein
MLQMPFMDSVPERMRSWGVVAAAARNAVANIARHDHAAKRGQRCKQATCGIDELENLKLDGMQNCPVRHSIEALDRKRGKGNPERERAELRLDIETCLAKESLEVRRLCLLLQAYTVTEAARVMGIPRSTAVGWLASVRERMEARGLEPGGG